MFIHFLDPFTSDLTDNIIFKNKTAISILNYFWHACLSCRVFLLPETICCWSFH